MARGKNDAKLPNERMVLILERPGYLLMTKSPDQAHWTLPMTDVEAYVPLAQSANQFLETMVDGQVEHCQQEAAATVGNQTYFFLRGAYEGTAKRNVGEREFREIPSAQVMKMMDSHDRYRVFLQRFGYK